MPSTDTTELHRPAVCFSNARRLDVGGTVAASRAVRKDTRAGSGSSRRLILVASSATRQACAVYCSHFPMLRATSGTDTRQHQFDNVCKSALHRLAWASATLAHYFPRDIYG